MVWTQILLKMDKNNSFFENIRQTEPKFVFVSGVKLSPQYNQLNESLNGSIVVAR